ncbi:MAG: hypothetical protein GY696_15595 [Gammaproteobacteria bacterium]|nr:hypothetical protein [Gammaproteobacteria bacterium]
MGVKNGTEVIEEVGVAANIKASNLTKRYPWGERLDILRILPPGQQGVKDRALVGATIRLTPRGPVKDHITIHQDSHSTHS